MKLIGKDLRLKPLKEGNELSAFVNTIYNELFNQIAYYQDLLEKEKDPLHYIVINTRLEETRATLRMYENVVDDCTEYKEETENER